MTPLQALLIDLIIIFTMIFLQRNVLYENKIPNWYKFLGGFLVGLTPCLLIICVIYYIKF